MNQEEKMRFKDQVAVVTGAARGIGRAIVLAFVGEGAKVALADVDGEALERLRGEIEKSGEDRPFPSLATFRKALM